MPLLKGRMSEVEGSLVAPLPAFILVCEGELGLMGVPADRIIRITKNDEVAPDFVVGLDSPQEKCQINNL